MLVVANNGRDIMRGKFTDEVGGHGYGIVIYEQSVDVFYRQFGAFVAFNN